MDVNYLIERWKKVRHYVKVMPFVLNFFYILSLFVYMYGNKDIIKLVDLTLYNSPIMSIILLILSYKVGLCKWHKTACLIPMIYFAIVIIHLYFISLSEYKNLSMIITHLSALISIIAGIKVFYKKTTSRL